MFIIKTGVRYEPLSKDIFKICKGLLYVNFILRKWKYDDAKDVAYYAK
jgi:hypothetical protein